ncbi:MAG: hypothetical protein KKC84_03535, partial [Candidatus Omnitrophica bacterium]|nr:hypothetical protein [Candidatus Omnitrophota bacterium]
LLSDLDEETNLVLIKEVPGIDVVIAGHGFSQEAPLKTVGDVLMVRPSWQGRRLGKLVLTIEDNKIKNHQIDELRLSDEIADDEKVVAVLPRCFIDAQCKKEGLVGACVNPGTIEANCLFAEGEKIHLTVISSNLCRTCNTGPFVAAFKQNFPGLQVHYLDYEDPRGIDMVKDLGIKGLPAYILGKEFENDKKFPELKDGFVSKGDYYVAKPETAGIAYLFDRPQTKGSFDVFLSLFAPGTAEILHGVREFDPQIHFLAAEENDGFGAAAGNLEVEEYLRAVCVKKYYPEKFYEYLICRAKTASSWWDNCLPQGDPAAIKACALGEEGKGLLKENIRLNKEISVMFGPAYLADNQQVFGSKGVPDKEELRDILKR